MSASGQNNSITVSYTLHPPSGVVIPPGEQPSKQHNFPVAATSTAEAPSSEKYAALRNSIAEAKSAIGAELTQWRDAVGDREKEVKRKKNEDDEDDEEEVQL